VWVFINNKLVVDLGGVHGEQTKSINLDTLNLTEGQTYDFDIFFAERHKTASNFKIQTTMAFHPVVATIDSRPTTNDVTPLINGSSPSLGGTTSGAKKVKVEVDTNKDGTIDTTNDATYIKDVGADGLWTIDLSKPPTTGVIPDLSNGDTAIVTVTATDSEGRQSAPVKQTLRIDTKAPNSPVIAQSSDPNTSTPVISGTAEPNSIITIKVGTASTYQASADATGKWELDLRSIKPQDSVPQGSQTVTVTATDAASNKSNVTSTTLKIDTSPKVNIDEIAYDGDTTPSIKGTADSGSTVTVKIDKDNDGSVETTYKPTVGSDGKWMVNLETSTPATGSKPTLQDGDRVKVTVTTEDKYGNKAEVAQVVTIHPPELSISSATVVDSESVVPVSQTNPTFVAVAKAGSTVIVAVDTNNDGTPDAIYTKLVGSDGEVTVDLSSPDDKGTKPTLTENTTIEVSVIEPSTGSGGPTASSTTSTSGGSGLQSGNKKKYSLQLRSDD
jgi:hypothetical protein